MYVLISFRRHAQNGKYYFPSSITMKMACRSISKWFTRNLFFKKQSHIKLLQHRHNNLSMGLRMSCNDNKLDSNNLQMMSIRIGYESIDATQKLFIPLCCYKYPCCWQVAKGQGQAFMIEKIYDPSFALDTQLTSPNLR